MKQTRLWRSLAEYENDPEFRKYLENEFGIPATESLPTSKDRRRFMQVMAASFAFAGATGCWREDKLLPMARRPEGTVPGVPRYFHTMMPMGDVALPLKVKSMDGRPIKVDGHPTHPDTMGTSRAYEQASILGMYDPDRSQGPAKVSGGQATDQTWVDFKKFALEHFTALRNAGGAGLAVLSSASSSKTRADMKRRFMQSYPKAQWFEYEAVNRDNSRAGSKLAFGSVHRTHYDLDGAQVVLSLEDALTSGPESLALSRAVAAGRDPDDGPMSRLYAVESSLSPTGIQADHRLALRGGQIKAFAVALEATLSKQLGQSGGQQLPQAAFLKDPKTKKFFDALAKDLAEAAGKSAVVVGEQQSPETHALGHRINALLGNVGKTVSYSVDDGNAGLRNGLAGFAQALGSAKTAIIIGSNPIYDGSGDVDLAGALSKVATKVHVGLYRDETALKCDWHLPLAHYLESWGDAASFNGTRLIGQPLVEPLYEGTTVEEFLAILTRDSVRVGRDLVQRALGLSDQRGFEKAVHDGMVAGSAAKRLRPSVQSLGAVKLSPADLAPAEPKNGQLEVSFLPCPKVYDGRFANNGWLQEMPEHGMKLTWDNAAFMSPKTAKALGVEDSTLVELSVGGKSIKIAALMAPGQAPGTIKLPLGYGRTEAGIVAGSTQPRDWDSVEPVGVDVNKLRTAKAWDFATEASVKPTGKKFKLATTQDKHPMDEAGRQYTQDRLPVLVRQDTLAGYKDHPEAIQHKVHHPPLLSLWKEPIEYDGHKWGMTLDLNKCNGCNACVVACNAENNVSVVGKDQVLMGREMHWMRIDRYFQGDDADEPEQVHTQPVICQHCENAPCEQVCPVGATMHSEEGLNDMAYNRCIGTRYCSNNCPYKVRRFNYFDYNYDLKKPRNKSLQMLHNPDVTIRYRGVMEKCSFCVQRIQGAKIAAKNEGRRRVRDQEVRTACQDVCPTQAIEFGDLNDKKSKVAKKALQPPIAGEQPPGGVARAYHLLQELNIRPRVSYLARITNPHPDLAPKKSNDAHAKGHSDNH